MIKSGSSILSECYSYTWEDTLRSTPKQKSPPHFASSPVQLHAQDLHALFMQIKKNKKDQLRGEKNRGLALLTVNL